MFSEFMFNKTGGVFVNIGKEYVNPEIKLVVLEITNYCNLNCVHCFNRNNVEKQHMSFSNIKKILSELKLFNVPQVWISGGEPLCHPNIEQIIELTSEYPEVEFCFTLNGTLLTKEIVNKLEKHPNIAVQLSVDGSSKEIHEAYRGLGTFDLLFQAMDFLEKSSIKKIMARTCVSLINYEKIADIYEFCLSKRLIPSFIFVENQGNANKNKNILELTILQKIFVLNELKKINAKYGLNIGINRPPKGCPLVGDEPLKSFFVKANGDIVCCQPLYDYKFKNIFTSSIEEYYNCSELKMLHSLTKQRYENLAKNVKCVTCGIRKYCDFGCIGSAYLTGNIMGLDSLCDMRKAVVFSLEQGIISKDIEYTEVNFHELEKTGYLQH